MDPVVHFEIPYSDADRLSAFYESAFGWKTQRLGAEMGNYILATTAETDTKLNGPAGAINGGFFPKRDDWPAQYPGIVIAVMDMETAMRKVTDAGGEVLGEPMLIPNFGRYVAFLDTEGNRGSILESG
jgi:uncharacterized protein